MNILFTLDSNYIHPFKVAMKSMFLNNAGESLTIYLMHSSIKDDELADIEAFVRHHGQEFVSIKVSDESFSNAATTMHYTKEMYYRLICHEFLPNDMEKILYIDPDTLIINSLKSLYEIDIDGYLFVGAYHETMPTKVLNQIRFHEYDLTNYYNSGVLLINLNLARQRINSAEIFKFVEENGGKLILPDQDVLNALFSNDIKSIDEKLYNYDARYFHLYRLKFDNEWTMREVIKRTVILHFCGAKKPWRDDYRGSFSSLYAHYENLMNSTKY
ncbi:MAG: glycosyltransferase family 8 protein [Campylobacteraceae bacterium]|nr:glycosyltransferase family 8 protein [Campylobacteraceae bacterium]